MLNSETISRIISSQRGVLIPILMDPLYRNCNPQNQANTGSGPVPNRNRSMTSGTRGTYTEEEGQGHWNPVVCQLVTEVVKSFNEV